MDPRMQALADLLVNYSVGVQPGQWVVMNSPMMGEPLLDACAASVLRAGGHPQTLFSSEHVRETVLREANDEQLEFISPATQAIYEQSDVLISLWAPTNTRTMAGIDPNRIAIQAKTQAPLSLRILEREAEGTIRWVGVQFPTEAAAQDAGMSLREYEDFVYGACLVGEPDPVKAWAELASRQQKVIDWLKDRKALHITAPGTDFTVSIEGRTWMNDLGHQNMPAGEVFTGPVEDSAEGVVQFTYPAFYRDQEVVDVCLRFEGGKIVEATAQSGEAFLQQMLDLDEGARRIGELAIGTNPGIQKFTKNTLFDEKIAGTFHMAIGKSIPGTGGTNESGVHWDMVCNLRDGGEITVDGQLLSKNGQFCI